MDRTVKVRYVADVAGLIGGLDKAAVANEKAASRIEGSTKRAADQLTAMQNASVVAGAGLAVVFGMGLVKAADFEAQMSAVGAATMETSDTLDRLREAAIVAGRDTQYSATEAARAITEMAKAGVDAEDILGGGLTGALNLAASGQMDVAAAAEIAATALNQFELTGKDLSHVADLYAAAAGKAQGSVQDIGLAMSYVGPIAHSMGVSIEEATGTIAYLASMGIIGEKAGTSFRSMLMSLTAPSKIASKAMQEYGIEIYGANGRMKSMADISEELRTKLGGLNEADRNAALGRIFGNEALGAAIKLMEGGASKITTWTKKVNDAGYSTQQAARLTDNLKGDLERLGGSVETVLIQGGSSASGALRGLVQSLDALVSVVGAVPGPVLAVGTALLAMILLGPKIQQLGAKTFGPMTSAVGKYRAELVLAQAAQKATYTQTGGWKMATVEAGRLNAGMTALRATTGGMRGAMSSLSSFLGGPWGIGLAVATTALTVLMGAMQDSKRRSDELKASLDQTSGALTDTSLKQFSTEMAEAFGPNKQAILAQYGVSIQSMTKAFSEGGDAAIKYADQIEEFKGSVTGGIFNADWDVLNDAQFLMRRFGEETNKAQGQLKTTQSAMAGVTTQAGPMKGAVAGVNGVIEQTSTAADQANEEMKKLVDTMIASGMVVLDRRSAEAQFQEALSESKTALAEVRKEAEDNARSQKLSAGAIKRAGDAAVAQAKSFNLTTEAGRKNQATLDSAARSALNLAQSIYDETGSEDKFRGSLAASRVSLIETGMRLGLSKKAAEAYADSILGIPPAKKTTVTNTAPAAASTVRTYVGVVNGVPQYKTTTVTASTNQAESAIRGFIDWLSGLRPVINVVGNIIGDILRRETGGPIPGPAAMKGRDSVLMLGAPGEHVWTDREVDAVGGHAAMYRLRAAALTGNLPKFDIGGPPGVPYSVRAMYRNTAVPAAGPASVDRSVRVGTIVAADPREAVRALDERMRMAEIVYA